MVSYNPWKKSVPPVRVVHPKGVVFMVERSTWWTEWLLFLLPAPPSPPPPTRRDLLLCCAGEEGGDTESGSRCFTSWVLRSVMCHRQTSLGGPGGVGAVVDGCLSPWEWRQCWPWASSRQEEMPALGVCRPTGWAVSWALVLVPVWWVVSMGSTPGPVLFLGHSQARAVCKIEAAVKWASVQACAVHTKPGSCVLHVLPHSCSATKLAFIFSFYEEAVTKEG